MKTETKEKCESCKTVREENLNEDYIYCKEHSEEIEDDLELKQLDHFTGTEQYHGVLSFNVTDGIKYIMENGYSWFVTDFLVVARMKPELRTEEFLTVKLVLENNQAQMVVTDGNDNILYTQDYELTNVKKELTLFLTNNVLMLSREY